MTFTEFSWARQLLAEVGIGRLLREEARTEDAEFADTLKTVQRLG